MKKSKKNLRFVFLLMVFSLYSVLMAAASTEEIVSSSTIKIGENLDELTLKALSKVPLTVFSENQSEEIHFILYRNNIFIPVSINDSKPCLFWVDTGGGTSFINSRHPDFQALSNGMKKLHVINVQKDDQVINEAVVLYNCQSMKFAGIELKEVAVELKNSDGFDQTLFREAGLEVCGMLGTTALRGMINQINYPKGTIKFFKANTYQNDSESVMKCGFVVNPNKGNLPYVLVKVNGKELEEFDFDTGCSTSLKISKNLFKKLGLTDVNGVFNIDKISFGDLSFEKVAAKVSNHPFSIIGYGVFRNFCLTIDYPGGIIYFEN